MKKVCGFTMAGTIHKAIDFDAKRSRAEISPHTTWDSAGMSNGLIQDLATAVVYRFICHNISGKKEANKVSKVEIFLLWTMRAGVRVCSMTFLHNTLHEIALTRRGTPELGHFVTALVHHFEITPEAYRLHEEIGLQDRTEMRCINYNELKQADLIKDRTTAKEYMKRNAYDTYFKKLQQNQPNSDQAGSSRPSTAGDENEQMDVDDDHFLPPPPARLDVFTLCSQIVLTPQSSFPITGEPFYFQASSTPVDDFYREHLSALQVDKKLSAQQTGQGHKHQLLATQTVLGGAMSRECSAMAATDWKRVVVINIVFLVFLIIVYSVGCCAFRNNREDNSAWKRYP
ncbi:senescence-associated protein [Striga asiatica]|uniref:Senescence-associated protein n=1 Tax=Striga asiatica TaxID=4170 RepID=A0A5A7QE08_STRAF|nr:senescence-associated protein [Striga asiatica]